MKVGTFRPTVLLVTAAADGWMEWAIDCAYSGRWQSVRNTCVLPSPCSEGHAPWRTGRRVTGTIQQHRRPTSTTSPAARQLLQLIPPIYRDISKETEKSKGQNENSGSEIWDRS